MIFLATYLVSSISSLFYKLFYIYIYGTIKFFLYLESRCIWIVRSSPIALTAAVHTPLAGSGYQALQKFEGAAIYVCRGRASTLFFVGVYIMIHVWVNHESIPLLKSH